MDHRKEYRKSFECKPEGRRIGRLSQQRLEEAEKDLRGMKVKGWGQNAINRAQEESVNLSVCHRAVQPRSR
jgi:hypothetical protein